MADDGRVFYAGRAVCTQGQAQITQWTAANVGLGCGPVHVWDPRVEGTDTQNPAKITKVADLPVFGAKGGGGETGNTSKTEQGILGIALDPDFTKGRPYIYLAYHPYWGGKGGFDTTPKIGPGFVRPDYMGERRLSRFTYNDATKTMDPNSEVIIHRFMTQVFSCCHLGGSLDWDSQGNLYYATGDNTGNSPNNNNGGYTNPSPIHTLPCPGGSPTVYSGTGCGVDTSDPDGAGPLPARTPCVASGIGSLAACGYISYADARQTSGNTNAWEGKLLRIKPLANPSDTPGIGTTYTIPGADAPGGGNLFAPMSQGVLDGKAKPEIFAMGVRNLYSVDVDKVSGKVTAAWVGPDQGTNSTTWGRAKTENAVIMTSAGNYGWPYCQGNLQGYRAKLPGPANPGGVAAPLGHPGTVGGGVDGTDGGWWDCDDPQGVLNDSPYNTGLERIPSMKSTNSGTARRAAATTTRATRTGSRSSRQNTSPAEPAAYRRCPWLIGGSQAPITGGIYRKPAGDKPLAWPAYWDGRWFMGDYSSSDNIRHALLMDPATEGSGGQPVSADSLLPIIPGGTIGNNRIMDLDFGPTARCISRRTPEASSRSRTPTRRCGASATTPAPDTPGPDPRRRRARTRAWSTSTLASRAASRTSGRSPAVARPPARTSRTRTSTVARSRPRSRSRTRTARRPARRSASRCRPRCRPT